MLQEIWGKNGEIYLRAILLHRAIGEIDVKKPGC